MTHKSGVSLKVADSAGASGAAELGIDLRGILRRSVAVLTHRLGSNVLLDLDLGGPLFFAAILGSVHLLVSTLCHAACFT